MFNYTTFIHIVLFLLIKYSIFNIQFADLDIGTIFNLDLIQELINSHKMGISILLSLPYFFLIYINGYIFPVKNRMQKPLRNIILIRLHKHRRLNLNQLSIRPLQLHLPRPLIILNNLRL